jgi:hypothetical protein
LACACGPKPAEFPVGFYGVSTPADADLLTAHGYDAIQTYSTAPAEIAALAKAARRNGQLLLASPFGVMGAGLTAGDYHGTVWYLQDEPRVSGVSPAEMVARDKKVRAWDPGSKSAFVVGDGHYAADFPGVGDDIMVDWYPVPHLPLESVGENVRLTAQSAGKRRTWAVLQAMDWRNFPQHHKKRIGRFPTMAEIRFMSYDAVVNGAQGIWYFTYSTAPASNLSQTPELMFAVDWTAREMRAMAPIFARGRPIPLPFKPTPGEIQARAWTYHGRDYVVLVNPNTGEDASVDPEMLKPTWRPLFEVRRDPRELLRKIGNDYCLRQHGVLVLESRLRLKRLLGR